MTRIKILSSIVLVTVLLATQIIAVGAAPLTQEETPPITGTVVDIALETDPDTQVTTVLVTLDDGTGATQTVRLSLEDANDLNLLDENGEPVDPATLVDPIEIDPELVIPVEEDETEEEAQHPVGSALSDFFSDLLGVDYETIMEYHEDGVGFGVIAQALWMTNALTEDGDSELTSEELFEAILFAKQNHDYTGITLPDGSTPQNWGQFRKAVMHDRDKAKENLGAIMSGRAEDGQGEEVQTQNQVQGNGNGNNPGQNNGNGPDNRNDRGNNGQNNGNGNNKNKDKDRGNPH